MLTHVWTPADVVLILTTVTTGVCSIIAALKATKSARSSKVVEHRAFDNARKLDTIHSLTNGNLCRVQEELEITRRNNEYLELVVDELRSKCGDHRIEDAKRLITERLAMVGGRRKEDVAS